MRWVRFAVLILVASVLQQTGLMGVLAVRGIRPDLLLIFLVFFAIRSHSTDAVIASFAIGFMADLISPAMGVMGPRIISFGILGTLLSDLQGIISLRRPIHYAAAVFITGALAAGLSYLLTFLRADAVTAGPGAQFFWQPLYSAVVGPFVAVPAGWWMHMGAGRRGAGRPWPM